MSIYLSNSNRPTPSDFRSSRPVAILNSLLALHQPLTLMSALPKLFDIVDVFWPECERYFRGKLTKRAPPTSSGSRYRFYISYEDGDYVATDLNEVRWHHAWGSIEEEGGCCMGEQEILRGYDSLPGSLSCKKRRRSKRTSWTGRKRRKYHERNNEYIEEFKKEVEQEADKSPEADDLSKSSTKASDVEVEQDLPKMLTEPAKLHWRKAFLREYMWVERGVENK